MRFTFAANMSSGWPHRSFRRNTSSRTQPFGVGDEAHTSIVAFSGWRSYRSTTQTLYEFSVVVLVPPHICRSRMSSVTMYPFGGVEPRQTYCRESSPVGGSARIGGGGWRVGGVACADADAAVTRSAMTAPIEDRIRMTESGQRRKSGA